MSKKIDCNIILDLLPLYHDDVVSEETKSAVREHLESCESCRKEFDILSDELPKVEENSTKNKFFEMVKIQKLKRILGIFLAVILGGGIAIGGIYTLTQEPLREIPSDEIEILEVFVTETDTGPQLFVWAKIPSYNGESETSGKYINDDIIKFEISQKVPILSKIQPEFVDNEDVITYSIQNLDVEEIYYNDKLIWSREENADDKVPAYVTNFLDPNYESRSFALGHDNGFMGLSNKNGDMIYYDLDGNIIDESTIDFGY